MSTNAISRPVNGLMPDRMRYFYVSLLSLTALSGFGQMPLVKRYDIADIPGVGLAGPILYDPL